MYGVYVGKDLAISMHMYNYIEAPERKAIVGHTCRVYGG